MESNLKPILNKILQKLVDKDIIADYAVGITNNEVAIAIQPKPDDDFIYLTMEGI